MGAVELSEGTRPAGSTWRRNPIPPYREVDTQRRGCPHGSGFPPPVPDVPALCGNTQAGSPSGPDVPRELPNDEKYIIGDELRVPNKQGDYVLQWRWDCEESLQIWTSCADITISL